jgi:hypothetical protein
MPVFLPDTMYDSTHTWQNMNDRVAYQRAFEKGTFEERRIAQAFLSANPLTPSSEIRRNMTARRVPPKTGYDTEELTISDIFEGDISGDTNHLSDYSPTDWSGRTSGYEGTSMPSLPVW